MKKNWWIWLSWIEGKEGNKKFIYSCMAQTHREDVSYTSEISTIDQLKFKQAIITQEDGIDLIERLKVDCSISIDLPDVSLNFHIKNQRPVLQNVLGQTNVPSTIYYSMPKPQDLFGVNFIEPLKIIFQSLESELGMPFTKQHAGRLGCFEVFKLHPWLDHTSPFLIDVDRTKKNRNRSVFRIYRNSKYANEKHQAHIQFQSAKETIEERLIELPQDVTRSDPIELPFSADGYRASIFDKNHSVIEKNSAHYLSQIRTTIHTSAIENDTPPTEDLQITDFRSFKEALSYEDQIQEIIQENSEQQILKNLPPKDRFFLTGQDGGAQVLKHLKSLIQNKECLKVTFVDPYFDLEAFNMLREIFFNNNYSTEITVLTCLAKKALISEQNNEPRYGLFKPLWDELDQNRLNINPNVVFKNFNKETFHDRYLALYFSNGNKELYSLSIGANGIKAKFPFLIGHIDDECSGEIFKYLERLENSEDINRRLENRINEIWPESHD